MTSKAEPITRRKLSHEVVDRLLAQIESGEIGPGSRLPSERELMDRYGVGRPAVREAMQTLENMGLISITHGERAKVVRLEARDMFSRIQHTARYLLSHSPQTLEHLKEARSMFELGMVKVAAEKAKPEDVARLRQAISDQEKAVDDPEGFVTADVNFHMALAGTTSNPICTAVSEAMLQWLREYHVEMISGPGRESVTLAEHRRILERVEAHDPEGATQAMNDHLNRVGKLYHNAKIPSKKIQ
jgi:DNA-binding FadR family transcriptional regulator